MKGRLAQLLRWLTAEEATNSLSPPIPEAASVAQEVSFAIARSTTTLGTDQRTNVKVKFQYNKESPHDMAELAEEKGWTMSIKKTVDAQERPMPPGGDVLNVSSLQKTAVTYRVGTDDCGLA